MCSDIVQVFVPDGTTPALSRLSCEDLALSPFVTANTSIRTRLRIMVTLPVYGY